MKRGRIFVISGPSGAGKDTLVDALLERYPNQIIKTVSATTRQPRPGEVEGQDYFFFTAEVFAQKLAAGEFLEYFQIHDHYYATLRSEIKNELATGKNIVLVIDVRGALTVKQKLPAAVLIFVNAPSTAELERRIRKRHGDNEESIQLRLADAHEEIAIGQAEFDHVIVNDVLEKAITDVEKIIFAGWHS